MSPKRHSVEPLSRAAWERVEAGVFARLDRGEHLVPRVEPRVESAPAVRSRSRLAAAVIAVAAAVALWVRLGPTDADAPVAQAIPRAVEVAGAQHETRIASTDAATETSLGEAKLVLAARSNVSVSGSDADGWLVRLDAGRVDCSVAPRRGRPPFVVQAGVTRVTVVGTRFAVIRDGEGARVSVTEGRVQVDSGESHVLLAPGESWPRPEPPAIPAEPAASSAAGEASTMPAAPASSMASAAPSAATASEAPSERRTPAPVVLPAQQRFDRAARLESKDPAAALSLYRQIARGKGMWAANALYAQARLELELGRPHRAAPLLRKYLQRYPRGLNAEDVRKLLDRIATAQH